MKYYIDTCIWRDYFENRSDGIRPLGEWALYLFNKIIKNKEFIVFSELVIDELKIDYTIDEINSLFEPFKKNMVYVKITKEHISKAKHLNIPFADALHKVLAESFDAILVTRDNHLVEFENTKKPEDLL